MAGGREYEGRVRFHFTPAPASWLNQIEIVFSLLQRKALKGASFNEPSAAIAAFIKDTTNEPNRFVGASAMSGKVNSEMLLLIYAIKH